MRILFTVPPDILNEDTSGDLSVSEGDNSTLWCRASGHPPPRVLWRKENGEPIFMRRSFRNFTKGMLISCNATLDI